MRWVVMMRWLWSDGVMKTMRRHNTVLWNMNMRGECPGKRYFFGVSMESEILLVLRKTKNFGWLQKETFLLVTRKKKTRLRVSAVWNHWTGLVALLLREMYQSLKKKTQERDTSLRRFNEQEYQVIVLQQRCWWVEEGVWLTYIQDQHIVSSIVE